MNGQIYNFMIYEIREIHLLKYDTKENLVTLLEPVIIFHKKVRWLVAEFRPPR
jgi:hypothetical protein